jgi:6-phosphogluconolactonase
VYSIDAASGELTPLGEYPVGKNPTWVEIVQLP